MGSISVGKDFSSFGKHFRLSDSIVQTIQERYDRRTVSHAKMATPDYHFFAAALLSPASGSAERFLVISDTHLTEEVRDHDAMMKAVVQAARETDAVLLLGDSTNNAHPEEHNLVLQWTREIRQGTGAEVYILPGNHDYRPLFGPDEFTAWYRSCGWGQAFSRDVATAGYAVMTESGTCLIMLDTNDFDQAHSALPYGGIAENTLGWVRDVLTALPDGTPVLVCGHHAVLPEERDKLTPGANALSRILRTYGVSLYLCGHDHGFATVEQEGLRQITVGFLFYLFQGQCH